MIVNKIIFLFQESIKSIFRSFIPSIVSSITIAISLIVLSATYFMYVNLENYTNELKDEYRIEVFFNNKLNLNESLEIFNKILLIDGIEEGAFIDKENASEIFKKEFNEDIVKIIGSNPLPMGGIYGISKAFRTHSKMKEIVYEINGVPEVDEALFAQEAVIKFDKISRNILALSFIIGLFIMLISLIFISNTILLVILSKKNEIKTMKLLGASKLFIKLPYILEGFILGVVGSMLSLLILFWMYKVSVYLIDPYYFIPQFAYSNIIILNVILGSLLGLIGTSRAFSSNVIK